MSERMVTLTEFLLARIAEDEAVARAATPGPWVAETGWLARECGKCEDETPEHAWHSDAAFIHADADVIVGEWSVSEGDATHIARHDPARVLAECAAKRRIVEAHGRFHECISLTGSGEHSVVDGRPWQLWELEPATDDRPCFVLRAFAEPYRDAPGFDDAWLTS